MLSVSLTDTQLSTMLPHLVAHTVALTAEKLSEDSLRTEPNL